MQLLVGFRQPGRLHRSLEDSSKLFKHRKLVYTLVGHRKRLSCSVAFELDGQSWYLRKKATLPYFRRSSRRWCLTDRTAIDGERGKNSTLRYVRV